MYVQRMYPFLAGLAADLEITNCLLVLDVPSLEHRAGVEIISLPLPDRGWYSYRMILGRVLLHLNYAVLRANRTSRLAACHAIATETPSIGS